MNEINTIETLMEIQRTSEVLSNANDKNRPVSLSELAKAIFDHHGYHYGSNATQEMFSPELRSDIQRSIAVWILRTLVDSPMAINFGGIEPLTASLFDRVFQHEVYGRLGIDSKTQTYEKINVLTDHLGTIIRTATLSVDSINSLDQLQSFQSQIHKCLNDKFSKPFFNILLPEHLTQSERLNSLLHTTLEYKNNEGMDPLVLIENVLEACDEFGRESSSFGTKDADQILGEMARRLKDAANAHFSMTEAAQWPELVIRPIDKKYPLSPREDDVLIKIKITNKGSGTARELKMDFVTADDCVKVNTLETSLRSIGPGDTILVDVPISIVERAEVVEFLIGLSWIRLGEKKEEVFDFAVHAQREDIDWEKLEFETPYSLEAVEPGEELIGRRTELRKLLRLTKQKSVGSAFIFGQRRVGKTSLANAVADMLRADDDSNWVIVDKGSGDYVGHDAASTVKRMGEVLVRSLERSVADKRLLPDVDFSNGLAPLSEYVDAILETNDVKIMFILDEFDDQPLELFLHNDYSTALFQPLRQISNKSGCGFLIIGGEGMQHIVASQGDRLNKFTSIRLDYFSEDNWSDFADLIRKPVSDWLTIQDQALGEIFRMSAGNPFFAKLIGKQLFTTMVDERFSDASETDVVDAVRATIETIDANSFTHFWNDGLIEYPDTAKRMRSIRRAMLIAMGRLLRNRGNVRKGDIWDEFRRSSGLEMNSGQFFGDLDSFLSRGILVEDHTENIGTKIPLFGHWLKDKGVVQLIERSQEIEFVKRQLSDEERLRVKDKEILDYLGSISDFRYQGRMVDPLSVRAWLDQFDDVADQRLMFRILQGCRLYGEDLIRVKMRQGFEVVRRNIRTVLDRRSRARRDILVSTLNKSAGKSGLSYCRLFALENQIWQDSVLPLSDVEKMVGDVGRYQRLVLVDDFMATGNTVVTGLRDSSEVLKAINAEGVRIVVLAVAGFGEGIHRIERAAERFGIDVEVHVCDVLGPEDKVFSETSTIFGDSDDLIRAKNVARQKGEILDVRRPLGYGNMEAAVVFFQNCPNNTLPIFWSRKNGWMPLFARQ